MIGRIKKAVLKALPSSVRGRLRVLRSTWAIRSYSPRVVEHTYGRGRLKVYLADPLGEGWYDNDWEALPELAELCPRKLKPGARLFDIGAHQGVVALMLAREVGESGKVVAVEPNPHNVAVALKNRDLNGMPQVELVQAAISDHAGQLTFNQTLNGQIDDGTGNWGRMTVDAVTVDGLAERFGMPEVVVLDVEGAECLALAGATKVLASGADFFVEVHVGIGLEKLGGSVAAVHSYFPDDRFTLLGRAEADPRYRPLAPGDPLESDRFFLLALAR